MEIDLILQAKVFLKDGQKRLVFQKPDYYHQQIDQFKDQEIVEVQIKRISNKRSNQQNRYWHGVCFPILSELTGYTTNEVKELSKKLFSPVKFLALKGIDIEIQKGTSELNKDEGWKFTQDLIKLGADLGGRILTPCEAGYNCGRKECPICSKILKEKPIEYPGPAETPIL